MVRNKPQTNLAKVVDCLVSGVNAILLNNTVTITKAFLEKFISNFCYSTKIYGYIVLYK